MRTSTIFTALLLFLSTGFISCSSEETPDTPPVNPNTDTTNTTPETPVEKPGPTAATNKGIDVSHYQGNIQWDSVYANGISFGYAKSGEGMGTDEKFAENWANMKTAGVLRGAYHFYYYADDPKEQAQHFLSNMGTLGEGDLLPMLDLEDAIFGETDKNTIDKTKFQDDVKTFLDEVELAIGVKPIIYTNHPFANEFLTDPSFADYMLWIAEYEVQEPMIPTTWENAGYVIWQDQSRFEISGITGHVDHDVFNGAAADLYKKIGYQNY